MVAWRALTRSLGFLSTLALARLLIPADFGLVAMASAFAGAIDSISQLRVEDVLLRRPEEDTRLHDAAFTLQLLRAVLTGGIIAAAAPLAAAWFTEPRLQPVLLVLAGLSVVSGLVNIGPVEFRRTLRYGMQIRLMAVPRLLQVVSTVAAAWLTHSYWALLIGIGVTTVSRVVMSYVIHPYRPRLSLAGWRELAGFSFWLWAGSLASLVWDRATTFIIGPAFGAVGLGVFQVSQDVAVLPVTELVAPASEVLLATLSLVERTGARAADKALLVIAPLVMVVTPLVISLVRGLRLRYPSAARPEMACGPAVAHDSAVDVHLLAVQSCVCVAHDSQGRMRQRFLVIGVGFRVKVVVIYLGHADAPV